MDPIAEIKSRITIEALVSQYVQLKKVGRTYKGLCPFHSERTPSFHVSPERGIAYCFGCHKGGDILTFVQEVEGLDFRGALKLLAERTGVTLPKEKAVSPEVRSLKERLGPLHDEAAAFFEEMLTTPQAEKARAYIEKRGLTESTVARAHIGYAPDNRDSLQRHLLEKGYTMTEIIGSGLVIQKDTASLDSFDRFRGRLMFPIKNVSGALCGFGGRALSPDDEPKYLNSPETPIFHKSDVLYGLAEARNAIKESGTVVVVEGYLDVLSTRQSGFENVVATSGTALTVEHLHLLKRFAKRLVYAFDQDPAGRAAAMRAVEMALQANWSVKIAQWDAEVAKDPDELCQKDPALFKEILEKAQTAMHFVVDSLKKKFPTTTIEDKKQGIAELLPLLSAISNAIELDEWVKYAAYTFGTSTVALYDELKRFKASAMRGPVYSTPSRRQASSKPEGGDTDHKKIQMQEYLLGLLLTYPQFRNEATHIIDQKFLTDPELQNIYINLTTDYNDGSSDHAQLSPREQVLALYAESFLKEVSEENALAEVRNAALRVADHYYMREKRSLLAQMKSAPPEDSPSLVRAWELLNDEEKNFHKTTKG